MPTYDYQCDACDHTFEHFQSISDPLLKTCPKCKKKKLRRLIGAGAAIVFKGSGFYQTDYRSDSYKKRAAADKGGGESKSESSGDKAAASKSEAKSDSKPSAKSDGGEKKSGKDSHKKH